MIITPTIQRRFWNPWDAMELFQEEMNQLLGALEGGRSGDFPAVNIWNSPENAVLTAEIPGIDPKDLELTVQNDTVTIRGSRRQPEAEGPENCLRQERFFGEFTRSFTLPFTVNAANVTAKAENGMLCIVLPRSEAEKPLSIKVQAA